MTCPNTKLLSDLDCSITLKCDLEQLHMGMHWDKIHDVFWLKMASKYAIPRSRPKIYIHKARPAPAILEKI